MSRLVLLTWLIFVAVPFGMAEPTYGGTRPTPVLFQDPGTDILATFQTYCLKIDTIFLERPVIESALAKRPEFQAWHLVRSDGLPNCEVMIEFTLPPLTWEWQFQLTHEGGGGLLGRGSVRALEEYEASQLLATSIVNTIQPHRRGANTRAISPLSSPGSQAAARAWNVKGVGGSLAGQAVNLFITRESIRVSGPSVVPFEIPSRNVLYAYHQELGGVQRAKALADWEKGWDIACEMTGGGEGSEGCLAMYGFPIYLLGEFLVLSDDPHTTHSVVLRLQEGSSVYEMVFLTNSTDWPAILADLQAAIPGESKQPILEAKDLRKGFEAAKENAIQIHLLQSVDVGRWPTLEPGDYKLVINERGEGRADVFFYKLPAVDFSKPRAVTAAQISILTPPMPDAKTTFLDKGGLRLFDEVRVGAYLLRFD
jgi:hypothetical protein